MDTTTLDNQNINIRSASLNDVTLLIDLGIKTFHDTFAAVNKKEDMDAYLTKSFNEEQVSSELRDANNTFLIVEAGQTPVGYCKLRKADPPEELAGRNSIEIERVYAVKEYLGRQVGKMMMDACVDRARSEGYNVIWLGVWEHNARAIAFYQKHGFEKFGSHPFVLGTDEQTDLLLKKEL